MLISLVEIGSMNLVYESGNLMNLEKENYGL